jgi:putative aldouronate transport system substrate-binding protein
MNGFSDKDWDKFQEDLKAYGIDEFLEIHQRYLDEYLAQ